MTDGSESAGLVGRRAGAVGASGSKIWTVRGVAPDLQSAVSAAAKSARMTLGEWTTNALVAALEHMSAPPPVPQPPPLFPGGEEILAGFQKRLEQLEGRLGGVERRMESQDGRYEGAQFRIDGLEHRIEGGEVEVEGLASRLTMVEGRMASGQPAYSPPAYPASGYSSPAAVSDLSLLAASGEGAASSPEEEDGDGTPAFTRGFGSRKRLTPAGEAELQRMVTSGADDAAISARLGIHKRMVWARRLTRPDEDGVGTGKRGDAVVGRRG